MLKLMRNALADISVLIDGDGKKIKWQYFKYLHELQSEEGLLAANKLNKRHTHSGLGKRKSNWFGN